MVIGKRTYIAWLTSLVLLTTLLPDAPRDAYSGFATQDGDCNDFYDKTYPGAPEICDGHDNNCDGILPWVEHDDDNDGWMICEGDCDDNYNKTYPGAPELCDGRDNDCNGLVPAAEFDNDGDGRRACSGDCNDGNAQVYSGHPEICDG